MILLCYLETSCVHSNLSSPSRNINSITSLFKITLHFYRSVGFTSALSRSNVLLPRTFASLWFLFSRIKVKIDRIYFYRNSRSNAVRRAIVAPEILLVIFFSKWSVSFIPQFYTEVTEVETWIREKLPRVSSDDYGRDETSSQSLLRKHETLELELDSYRAKVNDLRSTCQALVTADNFDKEKIQRRQVMIRELFYVKVWQ